MKEIGKVTEVKNNIAKVAIDKKSECDKCGMCLFPKGASSVEFDCKNPLGATLGDTVEIETERDGKLLGAILVFLVPLLLIGASALIGFLVLENELTVLLISVGLIIAWFAILSVIDKKIKKSVNFSPTIIKVITAENAQEK